jgi:arginyl-tRNA synthetase
MFKSIIIELLVEETKLHVDEVTKLLESPPKLEMGDFSFPCFQFANPAKDDEMWKNVEHDFFKRKNPTDIAKHFTDQINNKKLPKEIEKVEAKGPYVNFFINKKLLAQKIIKINSNYGKGKEKGKILTEFCHANTHKAFHIGHTRNITLGESISRVLEFQGYKVIRTNFQGDVGMHIAKTLWGLKHLKELGLETPKENKGNWLGIVYAKAANAGKDESIAEEINLINQKLYAGDKELTKLWKETRQWSIDYFEKVVYPDFGVKFDRFYFESEVEKKGSKIAKALLEKGIAKRSQGAIIMDLRKYNLDIYLILKSDNTPLYSTKDLYLAELQNKEYKPDRILHIVASEQNFYFQQLIKTLEITKPEIGNKEEHVSYELVITPTGKMASREGIVALYEDTIKKITKVAKKNLLSRNNKIPKKELEKKAKTIALAAIKYSMISQGPNKTITFNEKEAISFEGNTGPYLQYSYARASSILKKAKGKKPLEIPTNLTKEELQLLSQISKFPVTVEQASKLMNPALIANYSHQLAQYFNEFYHANPVIGSKEESFRLKLIDAFRTTLKNALYLLGIEVMEEM